MNDEILDIQILDLLAAQTRYPIPAARIHDYVSEFGRADAGGVDRVSARLRWMKDRGWVDCKVDDYRRELWFITEAGEIRRKK